MKKILISIISVGLPVLVSAQTFQPTYVTSLTEGASTILKDLIVVLIALAVVWFIWNVIKYSMTEDEGGKEKAREQMIHGIIAIAVCVSIWGIVGLLQSAFLNGSSGGAPTKSQIDSMIPGVL